MILVYGMKMHSYFVYIYEKFLAIEAHEASLSQSQAATSTTTATSTTSVKRARNDAKHKIVPVQEFVYFLVAPTMCFVRQYPRTKNIRFLFCLRMILGIFASACLSYILMLQFIDPILKKSVENERSLADMTKQSVFKDVHDVMKIAIPWFICWLLGSFALFHCYLNLAAELTRFADRLVCAVIHSVRTICCFQAFANCIFFVFIW